MKLKSIFLILALCFLAIHSKAQNGMNEIQVRIINKQNDTLNGSVILTPYAAIKLKIGQDINLKSKSITLHSNDNYETRPKSILLFKKIYSTKKMARNSSITEFKPAPLFYALHSETDTIILDSLKKVTVLGIKKMPFNSGLSLDWFPTISNDLANMIQNKPLINKADEVYDTNGSYCILYNFNPKINQTEINRLSKKYMWYLFRNPYEYILDEKSKTNIMSKPVNYSGKIFIQRRNKALQELDKKGIFVSLFYDGD